MLELILTYKSFEKRDLSKINNMFDQQLYMQKLEKHNGIKGCYHGITKMFGQPSQINQKNKI